MSGGRIQVESKDDIKKRIGRSPDDGDAVVQAAWDGDGHDANAWIEHFRRKAGAGTAEPTPAQPEPEPETAADPVSALRAARTAAMRAQNR
jgi:hypothetical protein